MTTEDFSNRFDVLLNSYSQQFLFGNGGNKGDLQLDEYEKSSLLSQAQDDIIKAYFVGDSANGGFDDSSRRQIDFSSLIKVASIYPTEGDTFDQRGILYQLPTTSQGFKKVAVGKVAKDYSISDYEQIILHNMDESVALVDADGNFLDKDAVFVGQTVKVQWENLGTLEGRIVQESQHAKGSYTVDLIDTERPEYAGSQAGITLGIDASGRSRNYAFIDSIDSSGYNEDERKEPFSLSVSYEDKDHIIETGTTDVLYILNEKLTDVQTGREYVIVPINYKEYDREMSKPYAQPYKKQAWRLLQNVTTGFDLVSELIPTQALLNLKHDYVYKIRYVKRPTPIILVDLPNGLQIDGYTMRTECTLNPILHNDILQRAVELAIQTRLSTSARYDALNKRNSKQGD